MRPPCCAVSIPDSICFLRLDAARTTTVRRIVLPDDDETAAKYVREAVQAYPELYFSRFVVLGEGDSEQVVLPRVLAAAGIAEDDASVSVVPLGGRHVNHFWRLLNELADPTRDLLDLDAGRYHGGWGRSERPEADQRGPSRDLRGRQDRCAPASGMTTVTSRPWRMPSTKKDKAGKGAGATRRFLLPPDRPRPDDAGGLSRRLRRRARRAGEPTEPDQETIVAVLGKSHVNEARLPDDVLRALRRLPRPSSTSAASPPPTSPRSSDLSDEVLLEELPDVLARLVEHVRTSLAGLPE